MECRIQLGIFQLKWMRTATMTAKKKLDENWRTHKSVNTNRTTWNAYRRNYVCKNFWRQNHNSQELAPHAHRLISSECRSIFFSVKLDFSVYVPISCDIARCALSPETLRSVSRVRRVCEQRKRGNQFIIFLTVFHMKAIIQSTVQSLYIYEY